MGSRPEPRRTSSSHQPTASPGETRAAVGMAEFARITACVLLLLGTLWLLGFIHTP
jgi:hypothetical protein